MEELSTIKLLNEILFLINQSSAKQEGFHRVAIEDLLKANGYDIGYGLLTEALFKIVKDGYLRTEKGVAHLLQRTVETDYYMITIEGLIFISNGFYVMEHQIFQRQNQIKNLKDWLLISGSWLAGVGACALVFVEVYKFLNR